MSTTSIPTDNPDGSETGDPQKAIAGYWWLLLILAGSAPLLIEHLQNMWLRPHHQYFPVVLIAIGGLIWSRLEPLPLEAQGYSHPWLRTFIFALSLPILLGGYYLGSPWIGAVAFVLAAGGCLLWLSESFHIENRLGIWLLFWLLVPLPGSLDQQLSQRLQRVTTVVGGLLLDLIGVVNYVQGTTIKLPAKDLFVEEACSGIVSLMSIVACCLILGVWSNRPVIHTVILTLSGVVWAGIMNTLRIVSIAIAQERLGVDLAHGWQHDLLGLVLFTFTILMTASTDRLLTFLLAPTRYAGGHTNLLVRIWNVLFIWGLPKPYEETLLGYATRPGRRMTGLLSRGGWVLAFLSVGAVGLSLGMGLLQTPVVASVPTPKRSAVEFTADQIDPNFESWNLTAFESPTAGSATWTLKKGEQTVRFLVDFPLDNWAAPIEVAEDDGWTRVGPPVILPDFDATAELEFARGDQESAMIQFSHADEELVPVDAPGKLGLAETLARRVGQGQKKLFRLQLWTSSDRSLTEERITDSRNLFRHLRDSLLGNLRGTGD